MRGSIRDLVLGCILLTAPAATHAQTGAADPNRAWLYLEQVRASLAAQPQIADFVQTYLPSGFASGEQERGRLALALPDCLRWDYETPYAKTFLLCGEMVYSWNQGEASGRRQLIDVRNESGLDLLRLGVDELRKRYEATLAADPEQGVEIVLTPLEGGGEITNARFAVQGRPLTLRALAWSDLEGNLTRFEISDYRRLSSRDIFAPPEEIHWLED